MTRRLVVLLLLASAGSEARTWALVAGENQGSHEDEPLRYAEDDASRFRDALVEVGDVQPSDIHLLRGATANSIRAELRSLLGRMAAEPGPKDRLYVYYSGHAGDDRSGNGVLHVAGTELQLSDLVDFVKTAPVEVGVLIVDACRSGSMTKLKGLKSVSQPPVRVEASGLQGRVLISASGADEYAQESEALKGSTFTHHFVTGLRGAADASRDGRVTLDEAYAWAWARTVESTFGTQGGVQRPSYKVDLSGQGQLVLAEPGKSSATLTLAVESPGKWLIVSANTGGVVAELDKPEGPMTIALPPGPYRVRLGSDRGALERAVVVTALGATSLRGPDLEQASRERIAFKGESISSVAFSAGGGVSSGIVTGIFVQPGLDLRLRFDGLALWFLNELAIGFSARDARGLTTGFRQSEFELRGALSRRFFISRLSLAIGAQVGALLIAQNDIEHEVARTSLGATVEAMLEARLPVVRPFEIYLLGTVGATAVRKMAGPTLVPRGAVSVGIAFSF